MSSGAARTYRAEELERATERSSGPRRDPPTNFRRRASSNLLRRGEGGGAGGTSSIGTTRRDGCAAASTIVSRERRVASCPRRGKNMIEYDSHGGQRLLSVFGYRVPNFHLYPKTDTLCLTENAFGVHVQQHAVQLVSEFQQNNIKPPRAKSSLRRGSENG